MQRMKQLRAVSLVACAMAAGVMATAAGQPLQELTARAQLRQPAKAQGFTERVVRLPVTTAAASGVVLPRSPLAATASQPGPILSPTVRIFPVRQARADATTLGINVTPARAMAGPVRMAVGFDTVVSPARRSNPAASVIRLAGLQAKTPRALPAGELLNNR